MIYPVIGPILEAVATLELDGRIVALTPDRTDVVFLNDTASDVWRLVDGTRNLPQIVAELAEAYEVSQDVIADDVRAVIDRFVGSGLIADPA